MTTFWRFYHFDSSGCTDMATLAPPPVGIVRAEKLREKVMAEEDRRAREWVAAAFRQAKLHEAAWKEKARRPDSEQEQFLTQKLLAKNIILV